MMIVKQNAALDRFNQWTLNGQAFSMDSEAVMADGNQASDFIRQIADD